MLLLGGSSIGDRFFSGEGADRGFLEIFKQKHLRHRAPKHLSAGGALSLLSRSCARPDLVPPPFARTIHPWQPSGSRIGRTQDVCPRLPGFATPPSAGTSSHLPYPGTGYNGCSPVVFAPSEWRLNNFEGIPSAFGEERSFGSQELSWAYSSSGKA